jgi:hypothetical protein
MHPKAVIALTGRPRLSGLNAARKIANRSVQPSRDRVEGVDNCVNRLCDGFRWRAIVLSHAAMPTNPATARVASRRVLLRVCDCIVIS